MPSLIIQFDSDNNSRLLFNELKNLLLEHEFKSDGNEVDLSSYETRYYFNSDTQMGELLAIYREQQVKIHIISWLQIKGISGRVRTTGEN